MVNAFSLKMAQVKTMEKRKIKKKYIYKTIKQEKKNPTSILIV